MTDQVADNGDTPMIDTGSGMVAETTVYARVVDGAIAEYPVFALHIQNRSQPFSWYTRVLFDPQPDVPEFFQLQENLSLTPDVTGDKYIVRVSYTVIPVPLSDLLLTLIVPSTDPNNMSGSQGTPMNIADIPQEKVERIAYLATFMAQDALDTFAATRNYTNIGSAISYLNSSVAKFKAEATYCNDLRDATWTAFYTYLSQVTSSQVPVPTKVSDIAAVLPTMAWPA